MKFCLMCKLSSLNTIMNTSVNNGPNLRNIFLSYQTLITISTLGSIMVPRQRTISHCDSQG